jgi:hypothetical protein
MAETPVHDPSIHLSSFLTLGFFPDAEPEFDFDLSSADPAHFGGASETELFAACAAALREAVERGFDPAREHLVPLSGGLDSRALLAVLLERVEASRLFTCTFGTPGTWDYELGNQLARRLGTRHVQWPLTEHCYEREELIETSRCIRHQTVLFHHPPLREMRKRFGSHVVWSGFLGDKLVKASESVGSDREAPLRFLEENRYVRSLRLAPVSDARLAEALIVPEARRTPLGLDEDLNFEFRQRRFIAPHVLPLGFEYRTPFTDPAVIGFFLSLPRKERVKARFYRRFLQATFPALFEIGTKNTEGLTLGASNAHMLVRKLRRKLGRRLPAALRRGPDPMLNYLDFERALRERSDLRKLVEESLATLAARRLLEPLDPLAIWQRHLRGEADHADALIVLTSLEIHLEAGLELDVASRRCSC